MRYFVKISFLSFVSFLFLITSSNANWIYSETKSAFADSSVKLAATALGGYALGMRCSKDKREAIFITSEKEFEPDSLKLANGTHPVLLLRVDDLGVVELPGAVVGTNGKMGMIAEVPNEVLMQVKDAKRRVAIAIKLITGTFHETTFAVRGSTKAVGKLIENCQVQP